MTQKKKTHLTLGQRYEISALLQAGHSRKEIAELTGKDKSVISRELKRNSGKRGYHAEQAQKFSDERKERFRKLRRFTDSVRRYVETEIREHQLSPEQIVGKAKRAGIPMVSAERIYQHVRSDRESGGDLYKYMRHKMKHRARPVGRRIPIRDRVSIDERPAEVGLRNRVGDIEADTVMGKGGKTALLTMTDRKSRMEWVTRLPEGKNAKALAEVMIRLLWPYRKWLHTITSDNGTEFAEHERVAKALGVKFYFAHPYSSWERGLNENTNGLIRQYIPKVTSIDDYSDQYISEIQHKLNLRPRKCLNYDCPKNVFFSSLR